MTPTTRSRDLVTALRRAGLTEVDTSSRRRAEYASDASLYRIPPQAVAFPRTTDELAGIVEVANDLGVPVTARGAGTSVAGNAIGPGIVVDTRRYLSRIIEVNPEHRTAMVEPGVVLDDLQRAVGHHGLRFGPDPSTHDRCTLGGMIGNNACGSRALGYGRTVDNIRTLEVVTGRGERVTVGPAAEAPRSRISEAAATLGRRHAPLLRESFDQFSRQVSGYGLQHLLPEHGADVARALVGSEGTCALTLTATVDLVPLPVATGMVILGYPDIATAADAVPSLLGFGATAIEGMDAQIPAAVRASRGSRGVPPLPDGGAWLIVELSGDTPMDIADRSARVIAAAAAHDHLVIEDPGHASAVWALREAGAGLAARASERPAHAGWEDAAVPPTHLGSYLRDLDELMEAHEVAGAPYGHFGDGCVHMRLDFPFHRADGRQRFRAFVEDAATLVASHGGSLSGEHGDGRARSELLDRMYTPEALAAFREFKEVFDPDERLNPGVLVEPARFDADLRVMALPVVREGLGLSYPHDHEDLTEAVHRCIGVGSCTAEDGREGRVMCPSYLATRDERDSTRGRARVLQELLTGGLLGRRWDAPEVLDALDLCLACKGCVSDCPTGVDMATYKAEVLYQAYRRRLRPWTHYTLGQLPRWLRLAASVPAALRRLLHRPSIGALLKRVAGIDPARPLPSIAERPIGHRRRPTSQWRTGRREGPEALLWIDTFTGHLDPEIAEDAATVLRDAGFTVRGIEQPGCCGLTWITTGQLRAGRRRIRALVDRLVAELDAAPAGSTIVGLEPSCIAVVRDAARLLGTDDVSATRAAGAVRTLAEVLAGRRPEWSPPRLDDLVAVAQPHCHHHAVLGWAADRAILQASGAKVEVVGGCCGLAGDFGVRRGYHEVSRRIAETQLLPAVRRNGDDVVVLADGFSCRTQVRDLAGVPTMHLAQLLAQGIRSRS